MAAEPIGNHVQHGRAVAVEQQLLLAAHCVDNRQRVKAVNPLCIHLGGGDAGTHAGQEIVSHGLAAGLAAHTVVVIKHIEEDGHTTALGFFPQLAELIHRSKGHGLVHRAAAHGAVAGVCHYDAFFAVDLLEQCSAGGNRSGTAHDGVVGEDAKGQEEGVHGTA